LFELDEAAMGLGYLIDDRQPQPDALTGARGIPSRKRAQQILCFVGGEAVP
jgi:hypothetical protein